MNTYQLDAFTSIVRNMSFTKAAKEMYVSQPAMSKAISSLEEELNVDLFTRQSNHLVLTQAGLLFKE